MILKMVSVSFILRCLVCVSSTNFVAMANLSKDQNLSIEEASHNLNNPLIRTIELEGGEVADCVDFYKQPSLDHPLLKHHKIMVPPESYAARRMKQLEALPTERVCPLGTVPILRRPSKENQAMAATPLTASGYLNSTANGQSRQVRLDLKKYRMRRYRGARADISIYNFTVSKQQRQCSSAAIWIQDDGDGPNYMVLGWMVGLYVGDCNPRLIIYWSADGGRTTGCYNLLCKGFVQVDRHITMGQILSPVSVYGGVTYDLKIKIFQDPKTGNWQLYVGSGETLVGYMPKEVLPNLKDGAPIVSWGGDSISGDDGISPPMGSGHKPDGVFNHAAYLKNLLYFARNYIRRFPSYYNTQIYVDGSGCFGIQNLSDYKWPRQYNILFGGPGGNCH